MTAFTEGNSALAVKLGDTDNKIRSTGIMVVG